MSTPVPLLVNPKAGSLFRSGLKAWLDEHRDAFRIINTKSAEELTDQARALAESGEPVVAAAGGDGTLMSAAQGLIGTDTALGILPCGTMNVFAREMGIGSRRFDLALEAIQDTVRREVDIFTVNGRPFLQMAGFGPDARVIQLISPKLKRKLGAAAHIVTGVRVAVEPHPLIEVTLPSGEVLQATQLIFGNGKRYGGEAHLFADARNDDGLLDGAFIRMEGMGILMEVFHYMFLRGVNEDNVQNFTYLRRMTSCDITADGKLAYELDGDYAGTLYPGETAHIERLPHLLRVCTLRHPVPVTPIGRLLAHPMVEALRTKLEELNDEF